MDKKNKDIKIVNGDVKDLNISNVYEHVNLNNSEEKEKEKKEKEIIIPNISSDKNE